MMIVSARHYFWTKSSVVVVSTDLISSALFLFIVNIVCVRPKPKMN